MYTINFWPILVAAIVTFGLSALWYSPFLFGQMWARLAKVDDNDVAETKARGIWKLYIVQFIATLISFFVLAFIIASTSSAGTGNGIFIGFLVWLGFVVTTTLSGVLWEKYTFKLAVIDTLSVLLNLMVGGAIIGAWK